MSTKTGQLKWGEMNPLLRAIIVAIATMVNAAMQVVDATGRNPLTEGFLHSIPLECYLKAAPERGFLWKTI